MKKAMAVLILLVSVVSLDACSRGGKPETILIGGLFDLSGKTSGVGREYAEGVIDYLRWVNEEMGGVQGKKIDFQYRDYGYVLSRANAFYDELKKMGVIAILGWGTGDTEALSPKVAMDRIPYISASYSENMADPRKAPYNFIGSVSYSDQARIALRFIKNSSRAAGVERPSVAFIYNDTGFGRSPFFPDGEIFARREGITVAEKIVVPLSGQGAVDRLRGLTSQWAIVQETAVAATAILQAREELGLTTRFIFLNWGMDKNVIARSGAAANGAYATIAYGLWDDPGTTFLHRINARFHPETPERSSRYIQGYISARILVEALKNAASLTGEGVKESLENLRDVDIGINYTVSFSPSIHKPASSLKIYQVEELRLVPRKEVIAVERKIWERY